MIKIGDYFNIKRGNVKHVTQLTESNASEAVRLVTATEFSNGGSIFFIPKASDEIYNTGLTVNNNGNVGKVFYHDYTFAPSSDVTVLIPKDKHLINVYEGLFLKTVIEKQKNQFMYGYKLSNERLKKLCIQVPLTKNKTIDWEVMCKIIKPMFNEFHSKLYTSNSVTSIASLNSHKWKAFKIENILSITNGTRLTHQNMINGNLPFIGASAKNNGITNWVGNRNKSLDRNVLGVNYNGSVVDNFYHPYSALFSDDVKRLHIKDPSVKPTPYKYLFLKAVILQHKNQYQYGYKFDTSRMKKQKILLPVNRNNQPDWLFMEEYIKSLPYADLI